MILEVKNLSKSYRQGETEIKALDGVSFSQEKPGSLAIVGPSGSGKTTLLSLLAGLDQASSGEISMMGEAMTGKSEKDLARFRSEFIGIVFQQFYLMPHLTALENVCLPLDIRGQDQPVPEAQKILEQVGLGHRMNHLPSELSGGECQRVAIARASVSRPRFLLADEPSGNLDTQTGEKVMQLLFDLTKSHKMNLILITHDTELAQRCDQTLRLRGGKIH